VRFLQERDELLDEPDIEPLGLAMSMELVDLVNRHVEARHRGDPGSEERRSDQGRDLQRRPSSMTLYFEKCIFRNNTQVPPVDDIPTYGVVSGRSPDNAFVFEDSLFLDNVYNGVSSYSPSENFQRRIETSADSCFFCRSAACWICNLGSRRIRRPDPQYVLP